MKKIFFLILTFAVLLPVTARAQEPVNALPEEGDIRVTGSLGLSLLLRFDGTPHSKPIVPLSVQGDYTIMTFADGYGSLGAGLMLELAPYKTWSTQKQIDLVGFKTTTHQTWAILAAVAVARYCFGDDYEAHAKVHIGRGFCAAWKQEYSDPSYYSIVPPVNKPTGYPSWGLNVGAGKFINEQLILGAELSLGAYTTLGVSLGYKF